MPHFINNLKDKVMEGYHISNEDALKLMYIENSDTDSLNVLLNCANDIRKKYMGNEFQFCSIINAKSGKCSEDCRFCAQSAHYVTEVTSYDLIDYDKILERALNNQNKGVHRFSLVTSGKSLSSEDYSLLLTLYSRLRKDTTINLCASHGIITYEQAKGLKEAGVSHYHHNLETSKNYYSSICTTHTYEDRVDTIKNVQKAGLDVCSGGIIGMGENIQDRIDMATELRDLNIRSVPINILNPIPGTPFENQEQLTREDVLKTIAVYRFILPHAYVRYAGGRLMLGQSQHKGIHGGINAALTGDYLTTTGTDIEMDKNMVTEAGFKI